MPPPRTRSSSGTPVWTCRVPPASMELMGTAGELGAVERVAVPPSEASTGTSPTEPHAPQSGQRPTHLVVTC